MHDHLQKAAEARLLVEKANTHLLSAMPSASAPQWATGLVSLISAQALEPKLKSMSVVDRRHETTQGKVSYLIKEWSLPAIPFLS